MTGSEECLVYSMRLSAPDDVAMILPLPVVPGLGESALEFVDLSGYPKFFEDVKRAFSYPQPLARGASGFALDLGRPRLVVHEVGSFEASFVPSPRDFDRLDPRFRLPDVVFENVPGYADYGFAVFQLVRGKNKQIHPMAFRFHTRDPSQIFFPTVHVHDGRFHDEARFAHQLWYQGATTGSFPSMGPLGSFVASERARGLIDPDAGAWQIELVGKRPNRDTWIPA